MRVEMNGHLTGQFHSDTKKRRFAMHFAAGDLQRLPSKIQLLLDCLLNLPFIV